MSIIWRIKRTHPKFSGVGIKDFNDEHEMRLWLNSDEVQQDMEDNFYFEVEKIEKED